MKRIAVTTLVIAGLVAPTAIAAAFYTLRLGDEAFVARTNIQCWVHKTSHGRVIDCNKGGASYVFPRSYRVVEGNHIVKVLRYDTSTTPNRWKLVFKRTQ